MMRIIKLLFLVVLLSIGFASGCKSGISALTFEDDGVHSCPKHFTCDDVSTTHVNTNPCSNGAGCHTTDGTHIFEIASDHSTGRAVSDSFYLPANIDRVQFLRAGGAGAGSGLYVKRTSTDSVLCSAEDGKDTDTLFETSCSNLSPYVGEQVYIELLDTQSTGWGKTYIDNIRLQDSNGNNLDFTFNCAKNTCEEALSTCTKQNTKLKSNVQDLTTTNDLYKKRFETIKKEEIQRQKSLVDIAMEAHPNIPKESTVQVGTSSVQIDNSSWRFVDILERFLFCILGFGMAFCVMEFQHKKTEDMEYLLDV